MSTIDEIRDTYPHPQRQSALEINPLAYCIFGACMAWHGLEELNTGLPGFPDANDTMCMLLALNPPLGVRQAYTLAIEGIEANDEGRFEDAWAILAYALEEGQEAPRSEA